MERIHEIIHSAGHSVNSAPAGPLGVLNVWVWNQSCLISDWLVSVFFARLPAPWGLWLSYHLWTLRMSTEPGSYSTLTKHRFRGKRRKVMWLWARDLEGWGNPRGLVVGIRSQCLSTATPSVPTGNESGTLEQGSRAQSWTLYRWLV